MTAEVIKEKLRALIKHYELEMVFRFLNENLKDIDLINKLLSMEKPYRVLQKDMRKHQLQEEQINLRKSQITYQLFDFVENLADADLAIDEEHRLWVANYLEIDTEKPITPEVDYLVNKIKIPDAIAKDAEKQQHFKLLMMRCQDDIAVGNYISAYQYCLGIKNYVEAESAQLYECLLVAYFKREGADKVVKEALQGQNTRMKHLVQYTNRYKKLDRGDIHQHNTGERNIQWVAQELHQKWLEVYDEHNADYIIDNTKEVDAERVKVCIDEMQSIFDIFDDNTAFLYLPLQEWVGCGKLQWIRIEEDWELSNFRHGIGALARIEEIEMRLGYDKALISDILYPFLVQKYDKIKAEISLKKQQEAMLRLIDVVKTCYILTENEKLLRLMWEEVKGNQILNWFELNDLAEVEVVSWAKGGRINLENDLTRMARELGEDLEKAKAEIRQNAIAAYVAETNEGYEDARISKERKLIIRCLNRWEVCYAATNDRSFFEKCFAEIYGNERILDWFELTPKGYLQPHRECIQMSYNVLYQYFQWRETYLSDLTTTNEAQKIPIFEINDRASWEALKIDLAQKLAKQTDILYQTLRTPKYPLTPQQAVTCLQQWQTCYFVTKDTTYLDNCITEVYDNQTIAWFSQISDGVSQPNPQCVALGFDLKEHLYFWEEELCKNKSIADKETFYLDIHRKQADVKRQLLGKMVQSAIRKKGGLASKAQIEKIGKI
ncbi:MAG: hypothetical protein ACKVTZ_00070 [Bacteroidia bacterium]